MKKSSKFPDAKKPGESISEITVPAIKPEKRKPGRPAGKRSDENFVLISAFVRKDTLRAIKHQLIDDGRELSELVQDLLAEYLNR